MLGNLGRAVPQETPGPALPHNCIHARVAQLAEASDLGSEGWGFESLGGYVNVKKKAPCGCPGPLCGDQDYWQMRQEMDRYLTGDQGRSDLDRIHSRWKQIAASL